MNPEFLDFKLLSRLASRKTFVVCDDDFDKPLEFVLVSEESFLEMHDDDPALVIQDWIQRVGYFPSHSFLDKLRGITHRERAYCGIIYRKSHLLTSELQGDLLISIWDHTPRALRFVTNDTIKRPYRLRVAENVNPQSRFVAVSGQHRKFGAYTATFFSERVVVSIPGSKDRELALNSAPSDWFFVAEQPWTYDHYSRHSGNLVCTNDWKVIIFTWFGDLVCLGARDVDSQLWRAF